MLTRARHWVQESGACFGFCSRKRSFRRKRNLTGCGAIAKLRDGRIANRARKVPVRMKYPAFEPALSEMVIKAQGGGFLQTGYGSASLPE
jgi:hypothetical protein